MQWRVGLVVLLAGVFVLLSDIGLSDFDALSQVLLSAAGLQAGEAQLYLELGNGLLGLTLFCLYIGGLLTSVGLFIFLNGSRRSRHKDFDAHSG